MQDCVGAKVVSRPSSGVSEKDVAHLSPSTSLSNKHDKTVSGDHHIEKAIAGRENRAGIANVLPAIEGRVAIKDLLPCGIWNGEQILLDHITVSERSVVEARSHNDFFRSVPPLKGNYAIRVRLVEDVNVVAAD